MRYVDAVRLIIPIAIIVNVHNVQSGTSIYTGWYSAFVITHSVAIGVVLRVAICRQNSRRSGFFSLSMFATAIVSSGFSPSSVASFAAV